jgi:hypothetical protein
MSHDARPDAANDTAVNAETDETGTPDTGQADKAENPLETQSDGNADESASGDTFPRTYVEELRKESAGYRERAKAGEDRAEAAAKRLHTALVAATGRLENPADLDYDAEHLDDADKLNAALDALLADRPYFAKRKVTGDAGQGPRGAAEAGLNLMSLLKGQ